MRSIDADIRSGHFKHVYLLYGKEAYLIRYYKGVLIRALLGEADMMNLTKFDDTDFSVEALQETADTMPFFSEHRVIVVENAGCFGKSKESKKEKRSDVKKLSAYLDTIPETAYLIFVETQAEPKTVIQKALYKKIQAVGDVQEMKKPDEKTLWRWISKGLSEAGLNMTKGAWSSFLMRTGDSMDNMFNEMNKLIDYCCGKDIITEQDVQEVCMNWVQDQIFDLIRAIGAKDVKEATRLYRDMLLLHESSQKILSLIRSNFLNLLVLKSLDRRHVSDNEIWNRTRIPRFALNNTRMLAGNFSVEDLSSVLIEINELEAMLRTGRVNEKIALETLMMKYMSA